MKKIVVFLIIFIGLVTSIYKDNKIYAAGGTSGFISSGQEFIESASNDKASIDKKKLKETSSNVFNILLTISFIIVAVVGIILGIKFMFSGVEEKADAKNALVIFVIGCIVIYGSFGIWKAITTFLVKNI